MSGKTVILIGPMSAGKSTVARELGKLTKMNRVPMDRVRWYYYLKDGFSIEKEESIGSFTEVMAYWKPFEVKAVKRVVKDFPNTIIDFGAGHSHYTDEDQLKQVKEALASVKNVILLLPSQSKEESLKICSERFSKMVGREMAQTEIDANRAFIYDKSNEELATQVVFTKDKSPEEIAREIYELLDN